ncbi:MAG: hypothetical protein KatS3mg108_3515 [Isosphaeraceae bacterium]|jgi:hypothetical protein|nr:MAG: hypothetical protein KatS3mg108_3515 [Isosphaeraceae bacterium]
MLTARIKAELHQIFVCLDASRCGLFFHSFFLRQGRERRSNEVVMRLSRIHGAGIGLLAVWLGLGLQQPTDLPEWTYPDADLSKLAVEYRTQDWTVRPPLDSEYRRKETQNEIQVSWTIKRGSEVVADLSVITLALRSDRNKAESVVNTLLNRLRRGAKGKTLEAEPPEHGKLNGNRFVRVRYRVRDKDGAESEGFLYVTDDTLHITALGGFASPEWNQAIQSALFTFDVID